MTVSGQVMTNRKALHGRTRKWLSGWIFKGVGPHVDLSYRVLTQDTYRSTARVCLWNRGPEEREDPS